VAAPIGSSSKEFRDVANTVGNTSTLDAFLRDMHKRYPDKDVSGLPGASPPDTTPATTPTKADPQANNEAPPAGKPQVKAADATPSGKAAAKPSASAKADPAPTGSILPMPKRRAR
jgi:hypothetical protein